MGKKLSFMWVYIKKAISKNTNPYDAMTCSSLCCSMRHCHVLSLVKPTMTHHPELFPQRITIEIILTVAGFSNYKEVFHHQYTNIIIFLRTLEISFQNFLKSIFTPQMSIKLSMLINFLFPS